MSLDQTLAIAGLVVGLLGIALAYYFYVKTIRTKHLVIGISEPVPIFSAEQTRPYYKVFFLLWNKGTAPIEQSDFISPIRIHPKDRAGIAHLIVKDMAANIEFLDSANLTVQLLRPTEAVLFSVQFLNQTTPELDVQMKSADMSSIFSRSTHDTLSAIAVVASIPSILFGLIGLSVAAVHYMEIALPLNGYVSFFGILGLLIITMIGTECVNRAVDRINKPRSPIVTQFSAIASTCKSARLKWLSLQDNLNILEKL